MISTPSLFGHSNGKYYLELIRIMVKESLGYGATSLSQTFHMCQMKRIEDFVCRGHHCCTTDHRVDSPETVTPIIN